MAGAGKYGIRQYRQSKYGVGGTFKYGQRRYGSTTRNLGMRYNTFRYGMQKYGASTTTALLWALEVDWNADGYFDGSNEATRMKSLSLERGRDGMFSTDSEGNSNFERFRVGRLSVTLDNYDRRYDSWYATSALYPNVQPGRDIRLRVKDGTSGSIYSVFRGHIKGIERSGKDVVITAHDGWNLLSNQRSTVALRTNTTADVLVGDVLDDAAWPTAWGRSLDVGSDTIPYAWVNDQSCYDALHDLAESEMGLGYVGADGKFYFKSRHTLLTTAAAFTLDQANFGNEPLVGNPWEGVKNKISVKAYPRALATLGEIWRLSEIPALAPGQSITLWATFHDSNYTECIAQGVLTPAAVIDYTMNTQADGLGTDLTASFTVTSSIFAGSAKLVVTNNGTVSGYITFLKIRGEALRLLNVSASISENSASQTTYGKHGLTLELPMQQSILVARDLSDWLLSWLKDPLPTMEVELIDQRTTQFPYDIGTYLTLTSAYLGLNKRFRICKIRHESAGNPQTIKTIWTLEPVDQQTQYWQLGVAGFSELGTMTRLAY